jgi:hypothetical protein
LAFLNTEEHAVAHPAFANALAMAAPRPEAPPVIRTPLPARLLKSSGDSSSALLMLNIFEDEF